MEGIELGRILAGRHHSPVVYFLRLGNRVKIGTTTNLAQRMHTYAASVQDVALLVPGGREVESAFHRRWAKYQINGREWFQVRGSLEMFLRNARLRRSPVPRPKRTTSPIARLSVVAVDRPNGGVTLAEASSDRGEAIVGLRLAALRSCRARDPQFPASTGQSGQTMIYLPADLQRWERTRPSAYTRTA